MWFFFRFITWEQRKLGDIGETYGGLSGKSGEDFGHGNAKFVTYMNVFTNPIADTEMTESIEIDSRQVQVKIGDVFFTTSSETPEEVGMSSVWLKNEENIYLNSFCFGYRPKITMNSYYLAYMLRSVEIREKIVFLAQGISRYNISKKKMMEITIPLPSDSEQSKLGSIFKQLDNLITLHQRKQNDKFSLFKPKNLAHFLANSWEQRKLGEVANIQKGQQLGKAEMSNNGAFYVLNGGMEPSGYTNQYNTFANTISISEGGNSCGYVSLNLEQFWSGGHNYTLQNPRIDTFFLYQWLKRHEKGIMALRVGSGLPNIQKSALQDVIVAYPKKSEQRAIAEILNKIDNLITLHQRGLIKIQGDKNGKKRSFRRIVQRLF